MTSSMNCKPSGLHFGSSLFDFALGQAHVCGMLTPLWSVLTSKHYSYK